MSSLKDGKKKDIPLLKGARRRVRFATNAFGEGTRKPRKARTVTRARGSEKRARERGRLRGGGEKRKKKTLSIWEIFKATAETNETKEEKTSDDPKGKRRTKKEKKREGRMASKGTDATRKGGQWRTWQSDEDIPQRKILIQHM